MKVLLNATTLVKGGAIQACISFIKSVEQYQINGIEFHFAISKEIKSQLDNLLLYKISLSSTIFDISPAKNMKARQSLLELEKKFSPNIVFTFFGPAYVHFKNIHVCGVADGWVTHSGKLAFKKIEGLIKLIPFFFLLLYKAYWYKKANYWIVETDCAKQGLIRRLGIRPAKIYIVPNGCAKQYLENSLVKPKFSRLEKIRILYLSAYYKHKNLELIPYVAHALHHSNLELDFEFVITLPENDSGLKHVENLVNKLGVQSFVNNIGPVSVSDGPELYNRVSFSFIPSVLETFSASYPEAMAMGLPIITSDLSFARDICGDAAVYFTPNDANDAATKINALIKNKVYYDNMVTLGKERLKNFPTPENKHSLYIDIIQNLSNIK